MPADPHLEAIDLASRRILFAQQIEPGPTLRLIAKQAAAEVGIVATRIVDGPAQCGQHLGGLCGGCKRQLGECRAGHQLRQFDSRLDTTRSAKRRVYLRRTAQLAVQAVPGDVRRSDTAQAGQCDVDLRLAFPDIQHGFQVRPLQ